MIRYKEVGHSPEEMEKLRQLAARVASGPQLQGSPKLREFFLYVVDCAFRYAPEEATEQHIGVHVFHRNPGYNSGDDSIVRSQARLLRGKLTAYFANEGAAEPIVVEIPKGQYLPVFHSALPEPDLPDAVLGESAVVVSSVAPEPSHLATPMPPSDPIEATPSPWPLRRLSVGFIAIAIVLISCIAGYWFRGHIEHPPTPQLDAFWGPFYHADDALIIFSNPAFIGNPTIGLRLAPPSRLEGNDPDADEPLDETYTGTGEAGAIQRLTQLFDAHGATFTLKRSRLVTWDEARNRNLIFVGAPSQNTALNDLHTLTQFVIQESPEHHGYIVNLHPKPGEPAVFPTRSASDEDAIVALLPGLQPDTRIAIFSGLSTVGTQEAVDFFCRPDTIKLLRKQENLSHGLLLPFEAIVNVHISRGVGVSASLLAIHLER
jgi:hypothetical protein